MNLHEAVVAPSAKSSAPDPTHVPRALLLRALNSAGALACHIHADDFTFASVASEVAAFTGIEAQRWLGENFWDCYLHPDDRDPVNEAKRAAHDGRRDVNVTFRVLRGASTTTLSLIAHRSAERASRRPVLDGYLIPQASDRRAPVSGDADAVSIATALEQAERDLVKATQLAVAGELVGAITHDLRQPLTALQVNLEVAKQLLHRTRSEPETVSALEAIADAIEDGYKMRDSLQVLHNLVAQRTPARAPISVDDVITDVAKLLQSEANARQVQLTLTIAGVLPSISGDLRMFRESILSVLLDAVKHAAPGSGAQASTVHLTATPVESVADAGGVDVSVTHHRRVGRSEADSWLLRLARLVAATHAASMTVERTSESEVLVRMVWPTTATLALSALAM